jgi:holin-like protein
MKNIVQSVFLLLMLQLMGEVLHRLLRLPAPGPVLGMIILAAYLLRRPEAMESGLRRVTAPLLNNMGLLFVPAGVGVVEVFDVLRRQWMPIAVGVMGSTLLALLVTGVLMQWLLRQSRSFPGGESNEP